MYWSAHVRPFSIFLSLGRMEAGCDQEFETRSFGCSQDSAHRPLAECSCNSGPRHLPQPIFASVYIRRPSNLLPLFSLNPSVPNDAATNRFQINVTAKPFGKPKRVSAVGTVSQPA